MRYPFERIPRGRFRAEREQLEKFQGLLPESQVQNLAATFLLCTMFSRQRREDLEVKDEWREERKAHRLLYHSTLGLRVITKKEGGAREVPSLRVVGAHIHLLDAAPVHLHTVPLQASLANQGM